MKTQEALPSPNVCFRSSCLASSLTIRLLPFKYSLYFCRYKDKRGKKNRSGSNYSVPSLHARDNSQWSRILPSPADWLVSYWCLPCSCRSQRRLISLIRWTGCAGRPRKRQSLPQWACPEGSAWLRQASSSPDTHKLITSATDHFCHILYPKLEKSFQIGVTRLQHIHTPLHFLHNAC